MNINQVKKYLSIFAIATAFVLFIIYFENILNFLGSAWSVVYPFVVGIVVAYIANLPYGFFYNTAFAFMGENNGKLKGKMRSPLSIVCAYLVLAAIIAFVLVIVIPQITNSINMLTENFDSYIKKTTYLLNQGLAFIGYEHSDKLTITEQLNDISKYVSGGDLKELVNDAFTTLFPHIYDITTGITSAIYTAFISIIVSIYMLAYKKTLLRQLKKTVCMILPKKQIKSLLNLCSRINYTVGRFIYGKMIDSFILGVLCFIGLSIFGFEYAALISIVIGITDIIPFFGPLIGAVPCFFLLLIINPVQALWFIVFIILLQQLDGNIISPKILGSAIGINGFWVMFGVIVGGGIFGFAGMLLGVPIFAVIYCVFGEFVNKKLAGKSFTVSDEKIDLNGDEIVAALDETPSKKFLLLQGFKKNKKKKDRHH